MKKKLPFDLSNAAGFNKNAEIPTRILKYLGFDRVVIGTFTYQPYPGNPRPRIVRYPKKESLVNNTGLPNEGVEDIVKRILNYGKHEIPLTASIASTPNKKNIDLDKTIDILNKVPYIDRIELDISCPNIKSDHLLEELLDTVNYKNKDKELYLKISPDLDEPAVEHVINLSDKFSVDGFTLTNSTLNHDFNIKGGASGNAVYKDSLKMQKIFVRKMNELRKNFKIAACGGINSVEKIEERKSFGNIEEIQIYTPLIFSGPSLLREFRF